MPWIKTTPIEDAGPELRAVYEAIYALYPADYATPVPAVTRADGNSVDAEAESAKLAANALEQQAAVTVAATRIQILRTAMGVQ